MSNRGRITIQLQKLASIKTPTPIKRGIEELLFFWRRNKILPNICCLLNCCCFSPHILKSILKIYFLSLSVKKLRFLLHQKTIKQVNDFLKTELFFPTYVFLQNISYQWCISTSHFANIYFLFNALKSGCHSQHSVEITLTKFNVVLLKSYGLKPASNSVDTVTEFIFCELLWLYEITLCLSNFYKLTVLLLPEVCLVLHWFTFYPLMSCMAKLHLFSRF